MAVLGQEDGVGLRGGEKGLGFPEVGDARRCARCTEHCLQIVFSQGFLGQS